MLEANEKKYPEYENLIAVDFDGVIHDNAEPFSGDRCDIPGGPIAGAREALSELQKRGYKVAVFTVRAKTQPGRMAVERWLDDNNIAYDLLTSEKPNAKAIVDDRAVTFDGSWDGLIERLEAFHPWNRCSHACGSGPSRPDITCPSLCSEKPSSLGLSRFSDYVSGPSSRDCSPLKVAAQAAVNARKAYEASQLGGKMGEQIDAIKRFEASLDELESVVKRGRQ